MKLGSPRREASRKGGRGGTLHDLQPCSPQTSSVGHLWALALGGHDGAHCRLTCPRSGGCLQLGGAYRAIFWGQI